MEEEKIEENQQASLIYELPLDEGEKENPLKGRLYLSGKEAANDMSFIHENNIKAVLSLTSSANPQYSEEDNINHVLIDASDNTTYDIEKDFDQSYEFIEENLKKGNLLIHCEKGISRSPTIAIAYIMRKEKRILSEVMNQVRHRRNIISPNGGFYFHLGRYNDRLKKLYSEEYNKNNQTKPTHEHNQNCKRKLSSHLPDDPN